MSAKKPIQDVRRWASAITQVTESDEPNIWRIASGELLFGRYRPHRNLVMLVGETTSWPDNPRGGLLEDDGRALPEATWRRAFTAKLARSKGRIYVTALDLRSADSNDDELSPWILRAVRPDAIVRLTLGWIRAQDARDPVSEWSEAWAPRHRQAMRVAVAQLDAAPIAPKRRGGRRPLGSDHWREFTSRCIALNPQGKGAILRTLAQQYGKSERTIANWIKTARDEEWLQRGERGRAWYAPGRRYLVKDA